MKNLLLGVATSTLALSLGCLQERAYLDVPDGFDVLGPSSSDMTLSNGFLRGDFGARRGFDGQATHLQGATTSEYEMSTVNIVREEKDRGAAMVILTTSGFTLDSLPAGEHEFHYDEGSLDSEAVFVNVCGGANASGFDYDAPAASGTLTVGEAPTGERTVQLHTVTEILDPATGAPTGGFETSDSSFAFVPIR
jgi:hypothetical protein